MPNKALQSEKMPDAREVEQKHEYLYWVGYRR
jgi:hypothetical protein